MADTSSPTPSEDNTRDEGLRIEDNAPPTSAPIHSTEIHQAGMDLDTLGQDLMDLRQRIDAYVQHIERSKAELQASINKKKRS